MALFHCMVQHGTVQSGSLLGGFPLGTVPGTQYFFSTTSAEVPSDPYHYQNVTCKLYWSLIGRRNSSLLHHWTCDTRPNVPQTVIFVWNRAKLQSSDPLDLNQHSQQRIRRNFCLNKCTFLYQPIDVCWGSTDVPLESLMGRCGMKKPYVYTFCTLYIFRVCFMFIFLPLHLCFASIKNNLIK